MTPADVRCGTRCPSCGCASCSSRSRTVSSRSSPAVTGSTAWLTPCSSSPRGWNSTPPCATIVHTAIELIDAGTGRWACAGTTTSWSNSSTKASTKRRGSKIGPLPEGRGVLGVLIDHPNPIRLDNIPDHAASVGFPAESPPDADLPRRAGPHPRQGVRQPVSDREEGRPPFSEDDEVLVQALAAAAGIAIDNARLYEQSRNRQAWIEATRDIATELLSGADPARVFQLVAEEALTSAAPSSTLVAVPVRSRAVGRR